MAAEMQNMWQMLDEMSKEDPEVSAPRSDPLIQLVLGRTEVQKLHLRADEGGTEI